MTNNVFANSLEIACKAAEGKAIAAAPDVCWSPPGPKAGPIPIPYANTAYAKDLVNASKTVFISGKPVAQRDKSYFKTSTGNEAATNAFRKGIVSGKIKGKCYFTSWSPNVMVEGYNVCRHTDSTTHNHGSTANTGPWKYLDTADEKKACERERERVEKKCRPQKDQKGKEQSWKETHCLGLNRKPKGETQNKEKEKAKSQEAKRKKLEKQLLEKSKKLMQQFEKILDKIEKKAAEKLAKLAAKSAVKGFLGPIGWAWTAYDVVTTGMDMAEMTQGRKAGHDEKRDRPRFSPYWLSGENVVCPLLSKRGKRGLSPIVLVLVLVPYCLTGLIR